MPDSSADLLKIWETRQTCVSKHKRDVTCSFFLYCCLIPSIRESLIAEHKVMTDCLCLPENSDCWECQSRHTASRDTQMEKHTLQKQLCGCTGLSFHPFAPDREDGMWKNMWTERGKDRQCNAGVH